MSDFWLGVFVALAVWKLIDALMVMAFQGRTFKIGKRHLYYAISLTLIFGAIANLIYMGLI